MRTTRLIARLLVTLLAVSGCGLPLNHGPALEESIEPIEGTFVGTARIVENYSSDNATVTSCDVSFVFLNGEYSVIGPREKMTSSHGKYAMGQYLRLMDSGIYRAGVASHPVLQGAFEYDWSTKRLLLLSQWDAAQDRLVEMILERTGNASELLPRGTADAKVPPTRRPSRFTGSG